MRKQNILLLLFICYAVQSFGQQAKGKVIYQRQKGTAVSYIEMYFNEEAYSYRTLSNMDTAMSYKQYEAFETRVSKSDTLSNLQKIKILNAAMPPTTYYGSLGDVEVTVSNYSSHKKGYCTKDTFAFAYPFIEWQLKGEAGTIAGLTCNKAIGMLPNGVQYEGWYAPAIPVSVAPFQFRGLPGLLIMAKNLATGDKIEMLQLDWPLSTFVTLQSCTEKKVISSDEARARQAKFSADLEKMKKQLENGEKPTMSVFDLYNN